MSTSGEARRFFDAIARRYDREYALAGAMSRRRLERLIAELPPRARVLDLGVGTGRELSALLDAGHAPTGLDFSSEMLAVCSRRARPVPLVTADFWQRLSFEDGAYDAVIALHGTLAHPPNETALDGLAPELARVLRDSGVFLAEVPDPTWMARLETSPAEGGELRMHRTATGRCLHEDRVARVSIEASALGPERWRSIFAEWASVRVEPLEPSELFVVATRETREP
jgi:SAM-dependent methyltransferase